MIGIFVADTSLRSKNWKRIFTFNWYISILIKLFTWYKFKKLIKKYPDKLAGNKFKDTPTHVYVGRFLFGKEYLIAESSLTQQLNYYYPARWEFEFVKNHKVIYDIDLFNELKPLIGNFYAVLQLIYFIRRWFWEVPFKWLYPLGKKLHGNKEIGNWGNWFVWLWICAEIGAIWADKYHRKYFFPVISKHLRKTNTNNFCPTLILDMALEAEQAGEMITRTK